MTSIKIALAIAAIVTGLLIVAAPTISLQKVFANPPPPTISCTNNGGHTTSGDCTGNTDSNGKTQNCEAKNSGLQKKEC
jgi:hypothetical protein